MVATGIVEWAIIRAPGLAANGREAAMTRKTGNKIPAVEIQVTGA